MLTLQNIIMLQSCILHSCSVLHSYHIVACGQEGNAGDIVVVPVQSFQALVAVEVPQLDRHVRAAARQHLTLLVQADILKN